MQIKKISIPIFRGSLTLVKDKDFKKVNKMYNCNVPETFGAVTLENHDEGFEYVVAFVDSNVGLLAHEAVHVCNYVFDNIGIQLDLKNDETQAYFIGWIVDEMDKFLNEIKK